MITLPVPSLAFCTPNLHPRYDTCNIILLDLTPFSFYQKCRIKPTTWNFLVQAGILKIVFEVKILSYYSQIFHHLSFEVINFRPKNERQRRYFNVQSMLSKLFNESGYQIFSVFGEHHWKNSWEGLFALFRFAFASIQKYILFPTVSMKVAIHHNFTLFL